MKLSKKRNDCSLQSVTRRGRNGNYLFFKTPYGSYNAYLEIAAKEAAKDCGARGRGNTRQLCREVCGF